MHARVANLRPATVADKVVVMIAIMRMPWVKLVSTSEGGADGSSMLLVINGLTKRPAIVTEQITELSATTISLGNE